MSGLRHRPADPGPVRSAGDRGPAGLTGGHPVGRGTRRGSPRRPGRRVARTAQEPPGRPACRGGPVARGISFSLTFIGGSGWGDEFPSRVAELQDAGRPVVVRRGVSDDDLAAAYRTAAFSVFPSLHEGFGLPVAESLAFGTPVITADFGATAETGFDGGAVLIDPWDDGALIDAMRIAADRPCGPAPPSRRGSSSRCPRLARVRRRPVGMAGRARARRRSVVPVSADRRRGAPVARTELMANPGQGGAGSRSIGGGRGGTARTRDA